MQKIIIILLLVVLGTPVLKGQDNSDMEPHIFEAWTGLTVKKQFSKRFSMELEDQFRINEDFEKVRLNFYELGLKYRIIKGLYFNTQYRFSFRTNARNTKRYSFDLSYKMKIKSIKTDIKYRTRLQYGVITYTGESVSFFRNKLTITKRITKKWSGYTSYEVFHNMNDEFEHQANRFVLGTKLKVSKHLQMKVFAQYDQDVHGKYKPTRSVFGLMGIYSFK